MAGRYGNRRRYGASSGNGSRWMNLRYAGTCKVCGAAIAKGERGYWDSVAKTVTCSALDCADADGLTRTEPLTGLWDKRTDTRVLADRRIGDAAPVSHGRVTRERFRGRCIDAPCCGCCD